MEIKLPHMSGIECLVYLKQLNPPLKTPLRILTEYADMESFRRGPLDFIRSVDRLKSCSSHFYKASLRKISRRTAR